MESQIDNLGTALKLLKNPIPQTSKTLTIQRSSGKLRQFLQLQIDQLATQSQIQWLQAVYYDPRLPAQREEIEASQTSFSPSQKTLNNLQAERWLVGSLSKSTLKPIVFSGIETGFYYYYYDFGGQNQPSQYLLLFIKGLPSYDCRQFIKRTAASIDAYLEEHQQNCQQRQQIQILEEVVQRVGHQLRHPLSLINLYAHNLKHLLPNGKEQEQVSVIAKTAHALNQSLTEIMQCASSKKLQMTSQDLRNLVLKSLEEFQGWIEEKHLQVCCSDRTLILKLDPLQIKQALSNLISNAIHFSPQGAKIFIDWRDRQGNVLLTLQDEGPGLSSEDLEQLFKPFYTRRPEGTGLGLAIAQKVVLDHGGKLWAKNAPGRGAKFSISLPRFTSSMNLSEENTAC
jgi:signal transduction histidine kinase